MIYNESILKQLNIEHEVYYTQRSKTIIVGGNTYAQTHVTPKELGIIKMIKNDLMKRYDNDTSYIKFNEFSKFGKIVLPNGLKIYNAIELDIDSAYLDVAYRCFGYLSKECYELIKEQRKAVRLIAIGSVASRKIMYKYSTSNGDYENIGTKFDQRGHDCFMNIAGYVNYVMERTLNMSKGFLRYVDAVFVTKEMYQMAVDIIELYGFSFKTKTVTSITIVYDGNVYKMIVWKRDEKKDTETMCAIERRCYVRKLSDRPTEKQKSMLTQSNELIKKIYNKWPKIQ